MEEAKMDKPVQCNLNSEVHVRLCWSLFWLLAEMTFFFITVMSTWELILVFQETGNISWREYQGM